VWRLQPLSGWRCRHRRGAGRDPQPDRAAIRHRGLAYGLEGPTALPTRLEAALDELEKDTTLRGLLGEELIHLFLAVKRHEVAKAAERARDYGADDWGDRVDEFEVAELFEFL